MTPLVSAEDQQQETTIDQQIAQQDQVIGDLDAEAQVEAQVNQIDPDNPIVNTIDEQQRQINQARAALLRSRQKSR